MHKFTLLLALSSTLHAIPVLAEDSTASSHTLSSNMSLVSNYVFRGISHTSSNPAIQGGMDYVHADGLYVGLWGSPVSWIVDSNAVDTAQYGYPTTEIDIYAGYKNKRSEDYGYDVGFIRYNYLGNYTAASGYALADTAEVYAAFTFKRLNIKYSYSILDQFMTVRNTRGSNYIELNADYDFSDTGYTLSAHLGNQTYLGTTANTLAAQGTSASYADFKFGLSKKIKRYVFRIAYTNTNASTFYTHARTLGGNWAGPMTTVSLTHSF